MKWLKEYLIKKFLMSFIIDNLDKLFKYLGKDGSKTVVGLLIVFLGEVLKLLPETAPYIGPILEWLKTLPADVIVAGGLAYTLAVGIPHKAVKWVKTTTDK